MARRWEQKTPYQTVPGVTDYQTWVRQWQEQQGQRLQQQRQPAQIGGGFGAFGSQQQPGASGWISAKASVPGFAPPVDYQQSGGGPMYMRNITDPAAAPPFDPKADPRPNTTGLNNAPAVGTPPHMPNTAGLNNTQGGYTGSDGGFRVNVPSGYGKPNAYYYNGHAVAGDQGQWITLPVAYNEAADTRRWEYNGSLSETTMRRAVRYAYDDVRDGRATDFNKALMARLTQFYNEAGGKNVGYTLPMGGSPGGLNNSPPVDATGKPVDPVTGQPSTPPADTTAQQQTYTNPVTGQTVTGSGGQFAKDLILASDEDARDDYLLRQLGIDPNNGGLYLDTILRTLNPIATRYTQLQGIGGGGGGPMINTQGNLDTLAGWLRGGNGLGQVQNWARQQMQGATGQGSMLRNLADANAQQNTLGQLLALETAGVNPILVQAYADYFGQGRRAYRDYNFNQIGQGAIQNPIDWLLGSQWADLLR